MATESQKRLLDRLRQQRKLLETLTKDMDKDRARYAKQIKSLRDGNEAIEKQLRMEAPELLKGKTVRRKKAK